MMQYDIKLKPVKIPGDGDCLFSAVATALHTPLTSNKGTPLSGLDLKKRSLLARKRTANFVARKGANHDYFKEKMPPEEELVAQAWKMSKQKTKNSISRALVNPEFYAKVMGTPGVWGGNPELAFISTHYRVPIVVFEDVLNDRDIKKGTVQTLQNLVQRAETVFRTEHTMKMHFFGFDGTLTQQERHDLPIFLHRIGNVHYDVLLPMVHDSLLHHNNVSLSDRHNLSARTNMRNKAKRAIRFALNAQASNTREKGNRNKALRAHIINSVLMNDSRIDIKNATAATDEWMRTRFGNVRQTYKKYKFLEDTLMYPLWTDRVQDIVNRRLPAGFIAITNGILRQNGLDLRSIIHVIPARCMKKILIATRDAALGKINPSNFANILMVAAMAIYDS